MTREKWFEGETSCYLFASHFVRGQILKKRISIPRSNFFPLRVEPILPGLHCPGKQTRNPKSCPPFVKMIENHGGVQIHLQNNFFRIYLDIDKPTMDDVNLRYSTLYVSIYAIYVYNS